MSDSKELELKERELALKEKELGLKENAIEKAIELADAAPTNPCL